MKLLRVEYAGSAAVRGRFLAEALITAQLQHPGIVAIYDRGELSSALKEVFLPHRAKVLETYLQACDKGAMFGNFQRGVPDSGQFKVLPARRTLGGGGTH